MKKFFVLCTIIFFVILALTPFNKASTISEEDDRGVDIAILDIVPYIWREGKGLLGELRISLEIQNVGDTPTSGWVKYYGNASYFINNGKYGSAWGGLWGVLDPGEIWIPKAGAGLLFVNMVPRIFNIEYELFPTDSTPENNYIKKVYLVRGGIIIPLWKHIPLLE